MPTSGLLYVYSKIICPTLSPARFAQRYEEVHIPDIFKTSGIKTAYHYLTASLSPEAIDRPYLALYPLEDLHSLRTDDLKGIPVHHDILPGTKAIFDVAEFDTRYYAHVQTFETDGAKPGAANLVISADFTPAEGGENDFDPWYRQEHLHKLAKCPGYRQTRRSEKKRLLEPPMFLALHEFEGKGLKQLGKSVAETVTGTTGDTADDSRRVLKKRKEDEP
ncbi:hypothetical protein B0A49_02989 [Cryomyces minteri]|uniref:EthD domain-containing protein n=1 Tax=Cryomyces minteri TaxID=331657 RepID=A0A4U0XGB4_9PEZI|nr:hypothetical protein B0A49_02989 [Cryomyces minteri]